MSSNNTIALKGNMIVAIAAIVIILLPIGYSLFNFVFGQDSDDVRPFLEKPDPLYDKCVRDTEYMRYHHWELLRDVRVQAVRYGIRGDVSFDDCRGCHTSREQFCNKCHQAASVYLDCFGCHYYPEPWEETVASQIPEKSNSVPAHIVSAPDKLIGGE